MRGAALLRSTFILITIPWGLVHSKSVASGHIHSHMYKAQSHSTYFFKNCTNEKACLGNVFNLQEYVNKLVLVYTSRNQRLVP